MHGWDDATDDANAVDVVPRVLDTSVVRREPASVVRAAADSPVRGVVDLLDGVPEASGVVRRNLAEDCTRHTH